MTEILNQIGQLFIVGFPGETPPPAFLDFIRERQIGGIILFEDNCATHQQAKENILTIKAQFDATMPFVAVDQEGGRVCRLKGAPAEFRAPFDYGSKGDFEHFSEDYTRAALFMESLGINLNLAPVCDIFINDENECLADRCFGTSAETVVPFVERAVAISKRAGLLSCLKHFPGLGAASIDPHQGPATADYDLLLWEQRERVPIAAGVQSGADLIMTTHLRLPKIDSQIATASREVVLNMIRQSLAFDGPVITDDLTMAGAAPLGDLGQRATAAFQVGHDLLLFGRDFEVAATAFDYFTDAVQRGEIPRPRLEVALRRVAGVKFKLDSPVLR
jgi:beta-N-acetylhexosaminidase